MDMQKAESSPGGATGREERAECRSERRRDECRREQSLCKEDKECEL